MTRRIQDRDSISEKQIFTTGEAAELCSVSQQTIIRCFDNGRLNGFRVPGSRFRRIPRSDLLVFMKKNGMSSDRLEEKSTTVPLIGRDQTRIQDVNRAISETHSVTLEIAENAFDAGMTMQRCSPDLIIISSAVQDMDPVLMRRRLDESDRTDVRIIYFTGNVQDGTSQQLLHDEVASCVPGHLEAKTILDELHGLCGS